MHTRLIIGFITLLVILSACTSSKDSNIKLQDEEYAVNSVGQINSEAGDIKEFTVHGEKFRYNPSEIKVKKGDTVRINFISDDMMHDFVIDGLQVRSNIVPGGSSETFEFVASEDGSFEYYCSVGNHRALGMVGTLVVEP